MVGFLDGTLRSIFSRRFYYNMAHKYRGIGLGLVFMLTIITILLMSPWKMVASINAMIDKIPDIVTNLPAVRYEGHKLTIDKPVPYYFKLDSGANAAGVLIDPDYKISDIDALTRYLQNNHIVLFLTSSKVITVKGTQMEDVSIKSLDNAQPPGSPPIVVTHSDWDVIAAKLINWGAFAICSGLFILLFISVFLMHLVLTFLTAIIVKILTAILGYDVNFSGAMRLSAANNIPVILISSAPRLFSMPEFAGKTFWGIWVVYLLFSVYSSGKSNQ